MEQYRELNCGSTAARHLTMIVRSLVMTSGSLTADRMFTRC